MSYVNNFFNFLWNNKKYIFIFIFVLLIYEFLGFANNNGDPIAMYAFSHAIKIGEVPYRDFNIISTPLYAFIMSIGLFVFDNYLMFIIEQSILVTVMFYFLFKLFDKKAWLFLLVICFTKYFSILPTYNFMCFFWMVIIVYLEKNHSDKDYLIGFLLGLAFLSKHTVGAFFILATIIINYKSFGKLLKRGIGCIIPCLIFLIYLICNNALFDFINLSFLGLFDFGSNNSHLKGLFFYLSIILFIVAIYFVLKHRKDKWNYYLLCCFLFCFPLYDINHFSLFVSAFVMLLIQYISINNFERYIKLIFVISILYSVLMFACVSKLGARFFTGVKHFEYFYSFESDYNYNLKVNKFLNEYADKNAIILSGYTMFYDLTHDRELNYFDVLLYGNHGYNGTEYMINKIKKESDVYIIVDYERYKISNRQSQYNKAIVSYVMNNYDMVDEKYNFRVYYKK